MSITLDVTGILKAAAHFVSNVSGRNGIKLYINFYVMVTALSAILGNDPVILSATLFLLYYTEATGLPKLPWLMTEFAAANTASMILFVGNPTNVVICEGFRIQNAAFTAYTILPFIACSATCLLVLFIQYRASKDWMPLLQKDEKFNVRADITDPVGAVVGSILLGGCLITALVVSFLNVDVWKITLPFAGAKFIFDIVWNFYKTRPRETAKNPETPAPAEQTAEEKSLRSLHADNARLGEKKKLNGLPLAYQSQVEKQNEDSQQHQESLPTSERTLVASDAEALGSADERRMASPESTYESQPERGADTDVEGRGSVNRISATDTHEVEGNAKDPGQWPTWIPRRFHPYLEWLRRRQPTLYAAFPRLPFALVPFAFSQFILIEALARQGWINIFARWLEIATDKRMFPTIWVVGLMGVLLCNFAGTNIGATILLTKVVRAAQLPPDSDRAAGVALAIASNIGAVGFVFSASLAGLLWKQIIGDNGKVNQRTFAKWNAIPLLVMTSVGLGVVSAEMAVLYRRS